MQQYEDIYSLQNYFAVNKYLHTVASVGFLFTFNIAFFRRLFLARVQVPSLQKEIRQSWNPKQRSFFKLVVLCILIQCE